MKKQNTKKLVTTALMIAIVILLDVTQIGYIPIGPLQLTLMCIPVVVGTLTLGLVPGLFLGLAFAITSIARIPQNVFYTTLFADFAGMAKMILVALVPRLLIPVSVHYTETLMRRCSKKHLVYHGVAAAVGPLTNTVFFLGLFYLLFRGAAAGLSEELYGVFMSTFTLATTVNAVAELITAVIICPPIIYAVKKAIKL